MGERTKRIMKEDREVPEEVGRRGAPGTGKGATYWGKGRASQAESVARSDWKALRAWACSS